MARRKTRTSARTGPRTGKSWRMPRFRIALRSLFTPLGLAIAKLNAQSMRRMTVGVAWITAAIVMALAWMYGVPRMQAFASQQRYADNVHVRFVDPPRWFNGDLANFLMQTAQMNLEGDPMKRDDLVACRDALLATGWFDEIRQVRRVHDDMVEIDAAFARPYAVIRDATGDHLVDVNGKLLAMRYERGARTNFVAVNGARFARPQRCGEVWEGSDVTAALRLLAVIDQQPWKAQVLEIDVTGFVDGGPLRLKTDNGASIVWGGAPGEEPGLEALAEGKLKVLDFMYRTYKRIDAGEANREIDLTDPRYVGSRDLAPAKDE